MGGLSAVPPSIHRSINPPIQRCRHSIAPSLHHSTTPPLPEAMAAINPSIHQSINPLLAGGRVIREPVAFEKGYWAGAPGAFYAAEERAWYLTYRIRRPRGVAPDRGG